MSGDFRGKRAEAGDEGGESGRDARHATPRWVTVFGAIALTVVLVFVVLLVLGGSHGPGRHAASGDRDYTPSMHLTGAQPQP